MRTLCDVCESAAAILFCAADEAALCRACDAKVHSCNKLANRHVRVGLADPSMSPAATYVKMHLVDGTSLCLQCDMMVHVGVKRTHGRFLLLRQRIEFPRDKPIQVEETGLQTPDQNELKREHNRPPDLKTRESQQSHLVSLVKDKETNAQADVRMGNKLIDLNSRPQRTHGQASINQDAVSGSNHESMSVVPVGSFIRGPEK